jgi:hypothetical protein
LGRWFSWSNLLSCSDDGWFCDSSFAKHHVTGLTSLLLGSCSNNGLFSNI